MSCIRIGEFAYNTKVYLYSHKLLFLNKDLHVNNNISFCERVEIWFAQYDDLHSN